MILSVVNHSSVPEAELQRVLRALNRQIAEDFASYWHVGGRLRLEGPIGRAPDPRHPEELRGDAILYLWDEADVGGALGYHDLNYRGIPFGVVFRELSEAMGEAWSVTLSHEALELILDPGANRLVRGPHPEDPTRSVYHWVEACDAVQAQSYEIEGVEVSNFVLPLYFTEADEEGSRNDFLGLSPRDVPLRSFGVAPGGSIGFFDPESGRHEQYFAPEGDAVERGRARARAGWARRAVRRQWERAPEPVLRRLAGIGAEAPLPGPWFEGFAVDVHVRAGRDPFETLCAALEATLGAGWRRAWEAYEPTEPSPAAGTPSRIAEFDVVPRDGAIAPQQAWEIAHALRALPEIADAEPEFVLFRADSEAIDDLPLRRRWAVFGERHLPQTADDYEWSLKQLRVPEAWAASRGEGVVIGHPDTGFLDHPELRSLERHQPVDTRRDWDFTADDDDAHAEPAADDWLPGGPGHGTATASVIVSPPGPPAPGAPGPYVSGVAPRATLVPLRVSNAVVHFSMRRLRKAIEYAAREGFHVVSMSLGGPFPSRHLHRAIRRARERGVVLVAAAGNHIPFRPVVWPARYPEVLAVAASNAEERPWAGSSRGPAVDVTAPGESVWRALVDADEPPARRYRVERSSGTSYATAHVAGICALWLSHHGLENLRRRYGAWLGDAFRYVLSRSTRTSPGLDPAAFGAGIADAAAALRHPLPARERVARSSGPVRARRARGAGDAPEALAALFPQLGLADVRRALESVLATDARGLQRALREAGDELLFRFATDPRLCRAFGSCCREAERIRARGTAGRVWREATFASLRDGLRRDASTVLARHLR